MACAARDAAARSATTLNEFGDALSRLGPLAKTLTTAQAEVMIAVNAGNVDEAKALINSKETSAWRGMRKARLDDIDGASKAGRLENMSGALPQHVSRFTL